MTTSEESVVSVEDLDPEPAQVDWWAKGERGTKLHMGRGPSAELRPNAPEYALGALASPPSKALRRPNLQAGPLALLVSAVCVIIGSVSPWATLKSFGVTFSAIGTDAKLTSANDFVSGWVTLIAGIALILLAGLMLVAREPIWRSASTLLALATVGYSMYALVDVYQTIHQTQRFRGLGPIVHSFASPSIGFGLIMVVVASGLTAVAALAHSKAV